ncbi:MAG: TonB family protein [Cyanobacteria bacterium P01_E01_bin.45]
MIALVSAIAFQSTAEASCIGERNESCEYLAQNPQPNELDDYYSRVQQAISNQWNLNSTNSAGNATASFFIQRDGSISGLEILESSGNLNFDASVLDSISSVAPFDRLPESYSPNQLQFQITLSVQAATELPPAYMEEVESKISEIWNPDTTNDSTEVSVSFEINRDGSVSQLDVSTSSGDSDFDAYALQALADASPFSPLPDEYPRDVLAIEYTLASSAVAQASIPERLQAYDCLEVSEIASRGPDRIDPGNYRNNTILLDAEVTNNCDVGFEVAAWRATIFPAGSDVELGGKTALVRSLLPGDTKTITFYIKFGDLDWTDQYTPARIVTEGFYYNVFLSSLTPIGELD